MFVRPTLMVVFDAVKDEMIVVTPVYPQPAVDAHAAYAAAVERLRGVVAALDEPLPHATTMSGVALALPDPVSNTTPDEYQAMVARAKEYIAAGDIFQVVLAQRFAVPFSLPSFALYRALRRTNPSPFLFHLDFGAFALVGSSPEILVRVRDGEVTIRPLAGTRRRGATPEEDKALEKEMLADPKERAEHLMLLDLGRNDVGRVASIGTVRVTESFAVERYSHVMHIVSHVVGKLDERHDVIDALMAGFPAGTLSGAPKVRAMQIIDELEKEKRGPYGGCVGYFSADGEMDSCIVLRTALVKDGRSTCRPAPASSPTATRKPSRSSASTRPERSSRPPRRPCASPSGPSGETDRRPSAVVKVPLPALCSGVWRWARHRLSLGDADPVPPAPCQIQLGRWLARGFRAAAGQARRECSPAHGRFMAEQGLAPQLILCSPAVRARRTLDLVLPHLSGASDRPLRGQFVSGRADRCC